MKQKKILLSFLLMISLMISGCNATAGDKSETLPDGKAKEETTAVAVTDKTANWLGGLSPEQSLAYMKEHHAEGLVIVEVNTDYWKLKTGFIGALHIPHDEMADRYGEIPAGKPVILHCGAGVVSVDAYKILSEKRKDIPQLSYIAGAPPVAEYNAWLSEQEK